MAPSGKKISDELHEAAEEMAFEFSQSDWEDALIYGFRNDLSMSGVLAKASGLERFLTNEDFRKLHERAEKLLPSFNTRSSWRNKARVWIANNARMARDALWDGNYELAKKLMKKGGKSSSSYAALKREVKREQRNDMKGRVFLDCREKDKRHDWNTCK